MDNTDRRIKIGQIGIGHNHAAEKMATLKKLSNEFDVVGIAEPDPSWIEKRGKIKAYEALKFMSVEELLDTPGLQAVTVETDVPDLVPAARQCIDAGMHIHMDKPAGTDNPPAQALGNFKNLLEAASGKGLTVQMGYMFRNNPAVQFAVKAAREGWLGRIFEIHCVMSRGAVPEYRKWLANFHGGAMYIFGCHLIDIVVAIMGRPDRVKPYLRKTMPEKDTLYDNGLAILEYRYATVTIRTAVVEVEGPRRRQLVICGDEGTIDIRPIEPKKLNTASRQHPRPVTSPSLTLSCPKGGFDAGFHRVPLPPMPGRYDEQLTEFARIIRGERPHPYSTEHDLTVQEATLLASGCRLE